MKRKDRRIYKKIITPVLDQAIKIAHKKVADNSLIKINKKEDYFEEILSETTLANIYSLNVIFKIEIKKLSDRFPQFDLSPYFFLRAISHFKILHVIYTLYLKDYEQFKPFDKELERIIENVIISKTPSEEEALIGYFNIHEAINEVLIALKEHVYNFKPDVAK